MPAEVGSPPAAQPGVASPAPDGLATSITARRVAGGHHPADLDGQQVEHRPRAPALGPRAPSSSTRRPLPAPPVRPPLPDGHRDGHHGPLHGRTSTSVRRCAGGGGVPSATAVRRWASGRCSASWATAATASSGVRSSLIGGETRGGGEGGAAAPRYRRACRRRALREWRARTAPRGPRPPAGCRARTRYRRRAAGRPMGGRRPT